MKLSFNGWYSAIVITAGLGFAAIALTAYATGQNFLIFVGMGIFMAICMTMTSIQAQRQHKLRKASGK
jgi:predicted RND superfamily exporter protein